MKIFIPRVPNTVSVNDLRRFASGVLKKRFHIPFTSQPGITSCDILQIKDMQLGITEHHGLISIWPDAAGQWFIQHLKNQRLHHKLLFGREYYSRSDRSTMVPAEDERRRRHLEIEKLDATNINVEGMDQFVQTHIS
jgi:hypothetical protein